MEPFFELLIAFLKKVGMILLIFPIAIIKIVFFPRNTDGEELTLQLFIVIFLILFTVAFFIFLIEDVKLLKRIKYKKIYKLIVEDFSFLTEFGLKFKYNIKNGATPSVVFGNTASEIQIGFDDKTKKMFIRWFSPPKVNYYDHGRQLLDTYPLGGKNYKEQVDEVRTFLKMFLKRNTCH